MMRRVTPSRIALKWGKARKGQAKTLILDIETAPIAGYVWRLWKQNVGLNQIIGDWYILSWAAKWLGDNKVFYHDQSRAPKLEDDTDLLVKLWHMLDEADFVVAHNGRKFDTKKINARFIKAGLGPPSPYRIIDTLEIAKAKFAFTSNKLEYISELLNVDFKKLKHGEYPGFALWTAVMAGDKAAWREMRLYNEYDVLSLEETYLHLRPWDDRHPNVNFGESAENRCPPCGSADLAPKGYAHTNTGKYQRYQCNDCGAWSRSRYTLNQTSTRKALLSK